MSLRHLKKWEARRGCSKAFGQEVNGESSFSEDEGSWRSGSVRQSRFAEVSDSDDDDDEQEQSEAEDSASSVEEASAAGAIQREGERELEKAESSEFSGGGPKAAKRSSDKNASSRGKKPLRSSHLVDRKSKAVLDHSKSKRSGGSSYEEGSCDIDAIIREVKGDPGRAENGAIAEQSSDATATKLSGGSNGLEAAQQASYCLATPRWLFDWETELSDMFGRDVARTVRGSASRRRGLHRTESVARRQKFWLCPSPSDSPTTLDGFRMACDDEKGCVEFSLYPTRRYLEAQDAFHAVIQTHDPQDLQAFLRRHPFHVEALLALSETFQNSNQPEPAFELVKHALHSLQCGFHPKFAPFSSLPNMNFQLPVDPQKPENWPLFKALMLYMLGLGAQGCNRAALATCRLLIRMDHRIDACHALLHYHHYSNGWGMQRTLWCFCTEFVRQHLDLVVAPQYEPENRQKDLSFSVPRPWCLMDLSLMLPSFAFSLALAARSGAVAGMQKNCQFRWLQLYQIVFSNSNVFFLPETTKEAVCLVTSADLQLVLTDERLDEACLTGQLAERLPHVILARALLLCPSFLVKILAKLNCKADFVPSGSASPAKSWGDLLFSQPLKKSSDFSHVSHEHILESLVACYVEKSYELWRPEPVQRWLHSCASQLHYLFQNDLSGRREVELRLTCWKNATFAFDIQRYRMARPSEFSWNFVLPDFLLDSGFGENVTRPASSAGSSLVSLKSHPIVVFFQTLLPWAEIDRSGLHAPPITAKSMINCAVLFTWSMVASSMASFQKLAQATLAKILAIGMTP